MPAASGFPAPAAVATAATTNKRLLSVRLGVLIFLFGTMVSCVAIPSADTASSPVPARKPVEITMASRAQQSKVKLHNSNDFEKHLEGLKRDPRKLAILLDFDGTLAPITQHPKDTVITEEGNTYLRKLTDRDDIFTAIISGRGLIDLKDKITVEGITRAGNHGLEIKYPDGQIYNYPISEDLQRNYTQILEELNDAVAKENAWVEDKIFSITFHYREAPLEHHEEMRQRAVEIIQRHGYRANQAHFAIEAKPPVEWNKGFAAEFILETTFGKDWRDTVKVIVAGDDTTDEDAMRKLKGQGATFRVSHDSTVQTDADFLLDSPAEVAHLLKWVFENM